MSIIERDIQAYEGFMENARHVYRTCMAEEEAEKKNLLDKYEAVLLALIDLKYAMISKQ